jgi:hypothetical protein
MRQAQLRYITLSVVAIAILLAIPLPTRVRLSTLFSRLSNMTTDHLEGARKRGEVYFISHGRSLLISEGWLDC